MIKHILFFSLLFASIGAEGSDISIKYVIVGESSASKDLRRVNEEIRVFRADLRSTINMESTCVVFNVFYSPLNLQEGICNSCLLNQKYRTAQAAENELFVSFSVLPTGKSFNTIRKTVISPSEILKLPIIDLSLFKNEVVSRLESTLGLSPKAVNPQDGRVQLQLPNKSIEYRLIVAEDGKYYLYDSPTLTEFYRVAVSDNIYYPIDNDGATINLLARPFHFNDFKRVANQPEIVKSHGFLEESEKSEIDRYRLSGRIFREGESKGFSEVPKTQHFWNLPPTGIQRTEKALNFLSGIGQFDFHPCFGILGGSYNYYFNKNFSHLFNDESTLDETYWNYFKVYKINGVDVKKFLLGFNCSKI